MWGKEVIKQGTRWRIGDGKSVNIFTDPWLPRPLSFKPFTSPFQFPSKVCDLMTPIGAWNDDNLGQLFLPVNCEAIKSIPLGRSAMEDRTIWHFESGGMYSIRSGYKFLVNLANSSKCSQLS